MATKAPWGIEKETSRKTASLFSPLRYSFDKSRATSMMIGNRVAGDRMWIAAATFIAAISACSGGHKTNESSGSVVSADSTKSNAAPAGVSETPARTPSGTRHTVLFVGTSLTAGLGLEPDSAYPMLIQRKIDSA